MAAIKFRKKPGQILSKSSMGKRSGLTGIRQEEIYKSLFKNNHAIMLIINPEDGGIFDANPAACKFYGYNYRELLTLKISDLNTLSWNELKSDIAKAIEEKRKRFSFRHRLKNGEVRDIEVYSSPIFINDRQLLYSIVHDITFKKKIENELIESEEKFFKSFQLSPASMAIVSEKDFKFVDVNKVFIQTLGISRNDMLNKTPDEISLYTGNNIDSRFIQKFSSDNSGAKYEVNFLNQNGEICNGFYSFERIRLSSEEFLLISLEDISELKKKELELIEAKLHAEEADKLKSAFLANMSHEIRTPMNAILGFTELLKEKRLTVDERSKYIEIIEKNGNQLVNLINDIIDISKIEADQLTVNLMPVNINRMLEELYMYYSSGCPEEIVFSCKKGFPGTDCLVLSDENRLRQVLINLLNNAFKFTRQGFITIGYKKLFDEKLEFYVEDSGIGISEKDKSIIFERFRQLPNKMIKNTGGTGLGLSISRALVELLGGNIEVISAENTGSRFFFTLPHNKANISEKSEKTNGVSSFDWQDKTILIAEDEETNFLYLKAALSKTNAMIIHARNGREAVEAVKSNPEINIVLMDIKMPEMNGIEATRIIKSLDNNIVVIAQTAYAMEEDKVIYTKAGCNDYLAKPITRDKLLQTVSRYL